MTIYEIGFITWYIASWALLATLAYIDQHKEKG